MINVRRDLKLRRTGALPIGNSSLPSRDAVHSTNMFSVYALGIAVCMRLFVPANLLDLFYDYDQILGGNVFLKIHPGTYAIFIVALGLAATRRGDRASRVLLQVAVWLGGASVLSVGWALFAGNAASLGAMVDADLAAAAAIFGMSRLTEAGRQKILVFVVGAMTINALITLGEAITHQRLLPYKFDFASGELVFRPAALLNHPLINGLFSCTLIPFIGGLRTSLVTKFVLIGLFAISTFAAESRFATITTIPSAGFMFFYLVRTQQRAGFDGASMRFLQVLMGAVLVPLVGILIFSGGFGERIAAGLFDQSSQARLDVYSLLAYLSPSELLSGVSAQRVAVITAVRQNIIVESPIVGFIFVLGVPMAMMLMLSILLAIIRLCWKSNVPTMLGATAFLAVASANNGLATKAPELLYAMVLICSSRLRLQRSAVPALPKLSTPTVLRRAAIVASPSRNGPIGP
jgi:hypothetical protein